MSKRLSLIIFLILIIVLAGSTFAFLYHDNSSEPEPSVPTEPPPVLWQIDLEHFATDFAVYGERVFICENVGNVLGFDAANSKLLWEKDVGGYVAGSSTLVIYEGKLYFGSKGSIVYRLDPTTGNKEMEYAAPVSSSYRSKSAPDFFVADGKVFAEADGTAVYDANTGELLWERPAYGEFVLTDAGLSEPESDYVYMYSSWRISANNGSILWKSSFGADEPAIVAGNKVIFWNSDPLWVSGEDQTIICVNTSSGETFWSFDVGAPAFQPTEYNGLLLFGAADGNFYALHTENGSVAWKTSIESQNIMNSAILPAISPVIVDPETQNVLWSFVGTRVNLGASEQVQYVGIICNLDLETGNLEYTNQFVGNGSISKAPPKTPLLGLAYLNGTLYLTAADDLWLLDQSTGNPLGTRHFEHYLLDPIAYRTRVYIAADLFLFAYN